MKTLKTNEINQLIAESNAAKREIPFADCEVGQDLDRDARHQIMRDLEDSDLINVGLLDEIEDRILNGNPYYVIALVRKQRIADLVEEGIEAWKAREIVDLEFTTVSKSLAGFSGIDATEAKETAQQAVADRKNRFAQEWNENVKAYGKCDNTVYSDSHGDYFEKLSQPINIKSKSRMSRDKIVFTASDQAKLDRINAYCA